MKKQSTIEQYHIIFYYIQGLKKLLTSVKLAVSFAILLLLLGILTCKNDNRNMLYITIAFAFIAFPFLISNAGSNAVILKKLKKIKFCNRLEVYPYIFKYKKLDNNCRRITFKSEGIPFQIWDENKHHLENALNISIFSLYKESSQDLITIEYSIGLYDFSMPIYLEDAELPKDEEILIGRNGAGLISFSFKDSPHILVGGTSGSGKTILLKVILYQCIEYGYEILLADFKGLVDYGKYWRKNCTTIETMDIFEKYLELLIAEMKRRKKLFSESETANIIEYNKANPDFKQSRIIIAVDEFADVLSATTKENKELQTHIINAIEKIARLGRAFGIHLILSTQRPDAVVMPSAIKNNILYRVAGKCDDNLSRIILDNPDAATEIPKNEVGVFLDSNQNLFKGFYINV